MSVTPVGSSGQAEQAGSEPQVSRKDQMGKAEFLNLLITQLRYQDPLKPMDDREFATQLAQFSSLDKITEQTKWSKMTYGLGLVGQTVTYAGDDGSALTGVVKALKVVDGVPKLSLGETEINIDQVMQAAKA
ncbi:MAG TPA: flagellar hook capping FlgD N-terminal domain-containing protein [Symbiobacteriaceae bacterium]|nr:flagellar hook capping FlgD N-terminal domain-containing protein [Symbiobacteriaceae bacterium]